jgi:hypothetical protein
MFDYEKAAQAIAGGRASEELIRKVGELSLEVRFKLRSEGKIPVPAVARQWDSPPPADERKTLEKILKAINSAEAQLSNLDLTTRISLNACLSMTGLIVQKHLQHLQEKHPRKRQGRPAHKDSAATLCAVIIRDLWREERGEWPSYNIEFRRACAALYAQAGGGKTSEEKDGFWRVRWKEAQLGAKIVNFRPPS